MDPLDPSNRVELGKTGITVPPLGFGASPLGNEFGEISEAAGIEAVHEAVKQGINYFDVSPYYGRTLAETVLGKALKSLPRDSFILSTKVGRYDASVFDFSASRVQSSIQESLSRLCVDYIDVVFVHDAEFGDLDTVVNETIPELVKLREKGIIRAVGVSGYPLELFPYVIMGTPPGSVDAVLSYCNYSLQNQRLATLLPGLRRQGVGVINASPLCMGLLTDSGGPAWHPADDETKAASREAVKVARKYGRSLPEVAMEFALGGGFDTTLVGIDSVDTLMKNVNSLRNRSNVGVQEVVQCFDQVRGRRWESGYFKAFP